MHDNIYKKITMVVYIVARIKSGVVMEELHLEGEIVEMFGYFLHSIQ